MVSIFLALISCLLGKETIVDIIGLDAKVDTTLIVEIPAVRKIVVFKIDVSKTNVANTIEEGRVCNSVDEVEVTSINDVLS